MWDCNRHSISYTGTNMAGKLVSVPFHLLDRLEKCNPNNLDLFLHISCQPYSLLSLANNTCFRHTLSETRQRFNKLYRRKVCTCSNWEFLLMYLINSNCVGLIPRPQKLEFPFPIFCTGSLTSLYPGGRYGIGPVYTESWVTGFHSMWVWDSGGLNG